MNKFGAKVLLSLGAFNASSMKLAAGLSRNKLTEKPRPQLPAIEVLGNLSRQQRRRKLFEGAMSAVNDRNLTRFNMHGMSQSYGFSGMKRAERRNLARAYARRVEARSERT